MTKCLIKEVATLDKKEIAVQTQQEMSASQNTPVYINYQTV